MFRRRIDPVRLVVVVLAALAGSASVALVDPKWKPETELLTSTAGVFATLTGFVLTVQTIAVSSSIARDEVREAEMLFRVKRLYFFFIVNLAATSAALGALALSRHAGIIPETVKGALLFIAPFALVTAVELPRTLWSNYLSDR